MKNKLLNKQQKLRGKEAVTSYVGGNAICQITRAFGCRLTGAHF